MICSAACGSGAEKFLAYMQFVEGCGVGLIKEI